jgi:hypothetical protein
MTSIWARSLAVWFVMLVIASFNGAFREMVLIPALGGTLGRAISTLLLSAFVILLTWSTVRWMGIRSTIDAWFVGALWVVLTSAFEFLGGHYLFGKSWDELLTDYNISRGRIWVVVLITTAVAPRLCVSRRPD